MFSNYQRAFLCSLGVVFTTAFVSYYVQFPGLISSSGIEPAGRALRTGTTFRSSSQWLEQRLGEDKETYFTEVDVICETIAIIGVVLSTMAASGLIHHGFLFAIITMLYCFLVKLGGTFYSFQWDILLLECGFVASICYAPWVRLRLCHKNIEQIDNIGAWPLRFLLFKLMFMSGVVKVLADCPTWLDLTALEYHFATQCLPGPFAWYAHQLHPFILRLSVAMTLLIEIPMAFLLIFPISRWRRFGAYFQIILQILIISSGNYNFFNILTMVLCIPCMEHEKINETDNNGKIPRAYIDIPVFLAVLSWCFQKMFTLKFADEYERKDINISLAMTKNQCNNMIEQTVPAAIIMSFLFLSVSGIKGVNAATKGKSIVSVLTTLFHLLTCFLCLGILSVPFLQLTQGLHHQSAMAPARLFIQPWSFVQPYGFSNGYGLFRRMTGVGNNQKYDANNQGWAGVPPSIVSRPEIILEGLFAKNNSWRELNFRWKPGNVYDMPKQVAPHQPRLDWQMWFAALGSYQHNPWLINLISRLLDGCKPVAQLLDEPKLASGDDKLLAIRANLYNYDFTRIDSEWNQRIPGVTLLTEQKRRRDQWWSRQFNREYLPVIEAGNMSLQNFVSSYGFTSMCSYQEEDKCSRLSKNSLVGKKLCIFCSLFRRYRLFWTPIIAMLAMLFFNYTR
mmetsp:Transcript_8643/g.12947  ORF Transcript_8643/g.12947 Transcript_8643/m.12947 type:complete len:677 (+) Transcript_8643:78-2108(+)